MKVKELATKNVVGVADSASVAEVQTLMMSNRISRVVVFRSRRPVGIITQKDLLNFLLEASPEDDLPMVPASEAMSRRLITISEESSVEDAAREMISAKVSSLIVLDEKGELSGILTKTDLCRYFATSGTADAKVSDYMTREAETARPLQSLMTLISKMARKRISRIIVVDGSSRPIGMVTLSDLTYVPGSSLSRSVPRRVKPVNEKEILLAPPQLALLTVGGVMSKNPICMSEGSTMVEVARIMYEKGISGLPVVGSEGHLKGVITKSDMVRAVADSMPKAQTR